MSKCDHSFALTQNVSWCFFLYVAVPTQRNVNQPRYVETSSQGVMSSWKVSDNPGLRPIKAAKLGPEVEPCAWNEHKL